MHHWRYLLLLEVTYCRLSAVRISESAANSSNFCHSEFALIPRAQRDCVLRHVCTLIPYCLSLLIAAPNRKKYFQMWCRVCNLKLYHWVAPGHISFRKRENTQVVSSVTNTQFFYYTCWKYIFLVLLEKKDTYALNKIKNTSSIQVV